MMKYVIVSGGVLSGLGKGVTASSIGVLLKSAGLRTTSIKIDPYLNSDAGTMSPFEHGEVFEWRGFFDIRCNTIFIFLQR